jgi:hypothetical protein
MTSLRLFEFVEIGLSTANLNGINAIILFSFDLGDLASVNL